MSKIKLLISACLVGENVKYNGGNNLLNDLVKLSDIFELVPVCPEVLGGMTIPRLPSEIIQTNPLKIINEYDIDMTPHFIDGAVQTEFIASKYDIKIALLKANSPSCGNEMIYDGNFNGTLVEGSGVTANLLKQKGIKVFNENQLEQLYAYIKQ